MRTLLLAAALPAVVATAAFAQTPTGTVSAETDGRMVCKRQAATGTRFARSTCRTRAQWEAIAERSRRQAAEEFNRPMIETRRD